MSDGGLSNEAKRLINEAEANGIVLRPLDLLQSDSTVSPHQVTWIEESGYPRTLTS